MLVLALIPETISINSEPVVLKRQLDATPKTQAHLDSLVHSLPGIDVSTLNCLRWAYGTGYSAKGYQTTITVYLDGSHNNLCLNRRTVGFVLHKQIA